MLYVQFVVLLTIISLTSCCDSDQGTVSHHLDPENGLVEDIIPQPQVPTIKVDMELLCQHWVHSREEQEDPNSKTQIFRRNGSREFRASWFRMRFVFQPDATCSWMYLHPADNHSLKPGIWSTEPTEPDVVYIVDADSKQLLYRLRVLELSNDVLRVTNLPLPEDR